MTLALELDDVVVQRGARVILRDVTLAVRNGEMWAVVGPNGAGKSTLLEAIVGTVPLARGTLRLEGRTFRTVGAKGRARALALVGREAGHDLLLSVRNVVELGRLPYLGAWGGLSRRDLEVVQAALEAADCTALANRPLCELSDGERQRVHFARVLAQEPQLLLMDEATAHLDLAYRHDTLRRVRQFVQAGGSALVVVHDLELAVRHATHVAVLHHGRLHAVGVPREVLTAPLLEEVFQVEAELVHQGRGSWLHVFGPARVTGVVEGNCTP